MLKAIIDGVLALGLMQVEATKKAFNRAFPTTFARRVRVPNVSEPEADDRMPGAWTKVTVHVAPDGYTWRGSTSRIWVDINTGTVAMYPSFAVNHTEYASTGFDCLADIVGIPTTLVLHPLLWPVRRYYAWQEERTGLDRNSRKLLEKLEGKVPADVHAALTTGFRALRAERLADDAAFRAQRAAEIAAATEEFRRTGKLSGT